MRVEITYVTAYLETPTLDLVLPLRASERVDIYELSLWAGVEAGNADGVVQLARPLWSDHGPVHRFSLCQCFGKWQPGRHAVPMGPVERHVRLLIAGARRQRGCTHLYIVLCNQSRLGRQAVCVGTLPGSLITHATNVQVHGLWQFGHAQRPAARHQPARISGRVGRAHRWAHSSRPTRWRRQQHLCPPRRRRQGQRHLRLRHPIAYRLLPHDFHSEDGLKSASRATAILHPLSFPMTALAAPAQWRKIFSLYTLSFSLPLAPSLFLSIFFSPCFLVCRILLKRCTKFDIEFLTCFHEPALQVSDHSMSG